MQHLNILLLVACYNTERINPGDQIHRLPNICKVTSGSTPEAADLIDVLYACIFNKIGIDP